MTAAGKEPTTLASGRRRIQKRAGLCGATRGVVVGGAGLAAIVGCLALAGRITGESLLRTWASAGGAGVMVALYGILAAAIGAWLQVTRNRKRWPAIWDRALLLPQTVSTLAALAERGARSPWERALLGDAGAIPLPTSVELRRQLPLQGSTLMPSLLIIAFSAGITAAVPAPQPGTSDTVLDGTLRTASLITRAFLGDDDDKKLQQKLRDLIQGVDAGTPVTEADLAEAAVLAREVQEQARARSHGRHQSAELLAPFPATADIGRWLRGEITAQRIDLDALAKLSDAEQAALGRVADVLRAAGLPDPAEWLRRVVQGEAPGKPPELADERSRWLAAQAMVELLRDPGTDAAASIFDAALLEGGRQDPGGAKPPPQPDVGDGNSEDPASSITGSVDLVPGQRLAEGEILRRITRYLNARGNPEWERILSRPEIKPHELRVVEQYRREQP